MKLNQSGMVLLVALVMVGLMSIIAVAAIRGSNMQEAMAGNLRDRNLAFQSAEAGLRIGEANVEAGATFGVFIPIFWPTEIQVCCQSNGPPVNGMVEQFRLRITLYPAL
jgi:hypothetical protein